MTPPRILAFLPDRGGTLPEGTVRASTLSGFLKSLPEEEWLAVLVSLSGEMVTEPIVERIARAPGCTALLLSTRRPSLEAALLAQRVGARALLPEPVSEEAVLERIETLEDEGDIVPLPEAPRRDPGVENGAPPLIGSSPDMVDVFEMIARVAPSAATVLLTGESGTGKEVVARALHAASARRQGPFVPVNCAAIPEHLLETELFGHEKGAFTGAVASRVGRFERAHGGTLFLDEIGDMSMVLQAKLLRALEERRVEPLGGEGPRAVDVRVVAATNRDLEGAMKEGAFREDLYFRLAVVGLALPPLRSRPADVRDLALHFAALGAHAHGRSLSGVTEGALRRLRDYAWPGNVRELRNVMDRAIVLSVGPTLRASHLRLDQASPRTSARSALHRVSGPGGEGATGYPVSFSLQQVEDDHLRRVLAAHDGHVGNAAEVLGIHRNTLSRKLREADAREAEARGAPS